MGNEALLSIIKVIGKIKTPLAFLITILILISISWLADGFAEIIESVAFSKIFIVYIFPSLIPITSTVIYIIIPILLSIILVELIFLTTTRIHLSSQKRESKLENILLLFVFLSLLS